MHKVLRLMFLHSIIKTLLFFIGHIFLNFIKIKHLFLSQNKYR